VTTPFYFLHVRKCAGTTMRHILENAFPAAQMMAAYHQIYYEHELAGFEPARRQSYRYYEGHFGWRLPAMVPARDWTILTLLREPVDRMLSLFSYMKQFGQLSAGMSLEAWLDEQLCAKDLATGYFVTESRELTEKGYEVARATANNLRAQALANLGQCAGVGVAEAMDESINIFASLIDALPPRTTSRYNVTVNRRRHSDISHALRAKMEHLLESDRALYERARDMLRAASMRLVDECSRAAGKSLDSDDVREYLRESSRRRLAASMARCPPPAIVTWSPDDIFRGENLHSREEHGGERLRWTGPGEMTRFELYLGPERDWVLTMRLHRATPPGHVQAARLSVNGVPLILESATDEGGFLIKSGLERSVAALSGDGVATFELHSPVVRGQGEFRMLGVAMKAVTLRAR
jgi:hypothetical protein